MVLVSFKTGKSPERWKESGLAGLPQSASTLKRSAVRRRLRAGAVILRDALLITGSGRCPRQRKRSYTERDAGQSQRKFHHRLHGCSPSFFVPGPADGRLGPSVQRTIF